MSQHAPLLETDRLLLRGHRPADLDACAAMWAAPAVVRYIGGKPSTRQQSWGRILTYTGHWAQLGFGYWAVEEKATGRFIGEVGFADFKRELQPSIEGIPEAGWVLAPHAHGKGYASEALRAALAWGDARFETQSVCLIAPENAASIRVAQKAGYTELLRTMYGGAPTILFVRQPGRSAPSSSVR